jgi:nucleotide-binding universal stress UspA family protein
MPGLTALIPLDGTKLSESAFSLLPFIKTLGFDRVRLVSVWESVWEEKEAPPGKESELAEIAERGRSYLEAYLHEQASAVAGQGFQVDTAVRVGRAADACLEVARDGTDLILIATHGRTGIARWRLGSVADAIIRDAPCPCLVIGPNVNIELVGYAPRRVVVPVDGSELAEQALPVAAWIAAKSGATIGLVRAVSMTAVTYDPSMGMYSVDLLQAMEDAAIAYMERLAEQLGGKASVTSTLLRGPSGEQILEHLQESAADLVVMASHGRAGLARAALGSVTDRVLHGPAPVLVLRPEGLRSRLVEDAAAAG